jgi:RmuC family
MWASAQVVFCAAATDIFAPIGADPRKMWPIEGALAAALTKDPELFIYPWDRHVVLVGLSTLLMTIRTVASIWPYEQQGQNSQEIH